MKKSLLRFLCAVLLAVVGMSASAQTSGSCGDNATWEYDSGTLTISGTGTITTCENPTVYPWWTYHASITSLVIGEGITNIPDWAFAMYESLASVSLPSTLKNIGNSALEECAFTSITLPDGLESIGYMAFLMAQFTELTIPSTVTNIDGCAFNYSKLVTVTSLATTPPSQTVGQGEGLFGDCDALTTINVPAASVDAYKAAGGWSTYSAKIVAGGAPAATTTFTYTATEKVTAFDTYANFTGATGVKSHTFADGAGTVVYEGTVTTVADGAMGTSYYSQNTTLTGIMIPSGVTTIGIGAFSYCSNLASVTLPADLVTLDQGSFAYTKIASITIPNQVENINAAAFMGCAQLADINIPNSVTFLGNNIFLGCSKLTSATLGSGITAISRKLFDNCVKLESIVIPDGVTTIGAEAFMGCTGLRTVIIGSGVTEIEDGSTNGYDEAFRDCSGVTDVYCYAPSATMTWAKNSNTTIFKSSKATQFHVADAEAWSTKFPSANVTFIGDLGDKITETSVGDYQWATFYNATTKHKADDNTTVYIAQLTSSSLDLIEIGDKVIPAGNAVILRSTSKPVMLTTTATSTGYFTNNSLHGSASATIADGSHYALSYKNSKLGFFKVQNGISIPAGKAYLTTTDSAREFYEFVYGTTSVNELKNQTMPACGVIFDLQGRKVVEPKKGIYIVNGHKVIIK